MIAFLARTVAPVTVLLAAAGGLQPAQTTTALASVDVLAIDAEGAPVSMLKKEDFRIVADGHERNIVSLTPAKKPLDIVLLLDLTASMSATLTRDLIEEDTETAVIDALQEGERLRIGGMSSRLVLNSGLSSDRRRLHNELRTAMSHRREDLYGPSPIWDSTYRAIESFPESGSRRAIILVTDGRATGNTRSIEDVAMAAILRRVSINIVGQDLEYRFNQSPTTAVAVRPGNALQWLADVTGGRFISATALLVRPAVPLTAILAGLRHSYTLTFEAPAIDDKPQKLEVRVQRPNLKVHARHLYGGPG